MGMEVGEVSAEIISLTSRRAERDESVSSVVLGLDSLVSSVFAFMASYVGNGATSSDVCVSSINYYNHIVGQGYLPDCQGHYMVSDEILENLSFDGLQTFSIQIHSDPFVKLRGLKNHFALKRDMLIRSGDYDLSEFPLQTHLDYQGIFDSASYSYLDAFLSFLLTGRQGFTDFPPIGAVLERNDLDSSLARVLSDPSKIVFCPTKTFGSAYLRLREH